MREKETTMKKIVVSGGFDNLRSRDFRFLDKASERGDLHAVMWDDDALREMKGGEPKFPQEEREYLLQAIRYVKDVRIVSGPIDPDAVPVLDGGKPDVWAVREADDTPARQAACEAAGVEYAVLKDADLEDFPTEPGDATYPDSPNKKVIVTGCYDWFHSGHVAFFEEVSGHGDLCVVVGNDKNVELLKGEGHPMFSERERRYVVSSIRYVTLALVSSGSGWMDAEPEIERIKPDAYAVNEDGDKKDKQEFCKKHELEYLVLKRVPKEGLPRRESTHLRGF